MRSLNTAPDSGAQATLAGLRVKLPPCRSCGCIIAFVDDDMRVICHCGSPRCRLDHETQRFLIDFIAVFGRPAAPIEIRDSQTSLPPPGAGATTSSNAPTQD